MAVKTTETNSTKPLVSVVMPTYNRDRFIGEAIKSVLNQTYKNFELIIVDNYSQDNTSDIVNSFSDDRIRYFKFRNYGIIAASKNFGIKKSKGNYIAFLDSDDIWLKDKIKAQLEVFEKAPEVGLSFCPFRLNNPGGDIHGRVVGFYGREVYGNLHNWLILYNFITSSSAMIRSSIKEEIGFFDESARICTAEDWDLWLRIAKRYKLSGLSSVMGVYRLHKGNLSMLDRRLDATFNVIEKHHRRGWISRSLLKKAKAYFYCRQAWCFTSQDARTARRLFYAALREDRNDFKVASMCFGGILLSFFPILPRFFQKSSLDKKIKDIIFNKK